MSKGFDAAIMPPIHAHRTGSKGSANSGNEGAMEKQPNEKHGLLDDDDLDEAIANVDDTGMVKSMQQIRIGEESEHLPPADESQEPEEPLP